MKILSFDVGIRNLAFCFFDIPQEIYKQNTEINEIIKHIKILKWDIINLSNDEKNTSCNGKHKNGNPCKMNALYKKNNIYYCKKHASQSKYIIPTRENTINSIKKKKKEYVIEYFNKILMNECTCISNGNGVGNGINSDNSTNIQNKEYYIHKISQYLIDNCLEKIYETKVNTIDMVSIGLIMRNKLDELFKTDDIDLVLIENQISPIANRMKTVQGMLTQYFIMRDIENIHYVSASNKLKLFIQTKTTYKERKKAGVEIMENNILSHLETGKWIHTFSKHKKKDDLADSFLQSLYYLVN